jgi:hypothetical protein
VFGRTAAILAAPVPAGSRRYDTNQDSTINCGRSPARMDAQAQQKLIQIKRQILDFP